MDNRHEQEVHMAKIIADTIVYYGTDTSRRCIGKGGQCYFTAKQAGLPETQTEGCAVGRLMSPAQKAEVEARSINDTVEALPPNVVPEALSNCDFSLILGDALQDIHDRGYHWDNTGMGLTSLGEDSILRICRDELTLSQSVIDEYIVPAMREVNELRDSRLKKLRSTENNNDTTDTTNN